MNDFVFQSGRSDEPDIAGNSSKTIVFGKHNRGNDATFTYYSFWHDEANDTGFYVPGKCGRVHRYRLLMRLNGPCTRKKTSHKKIDQTIYLIAQHLYCGPSSKRSKDRRSNQRYDGRIHDTFIPCMRCDRMEAYCMVTVNACPVCRDPFMFGGGSCIETLF